MYFVVFVEVLWAELGLQTNRAICEQFETQLDNGSARHINKLAELELTKARLKLAPELSIYNKIQLLDFYWWFEYKNLDFPFDC